MASASQMPAVRTASICTADAERGTHSFKIANYSLHKGLGVGKCIYSATFTVGGHQWRILFFPDGRMEERKDCVAIFLQLVSLGAAVRALITLRLVDPATGLSPSVSASHVFASNCCWGSSEFRTRTELEGSYVQDDCLVIECDVTVVKEPRAAGMDKAVDVQVPPSDLSDIVKFLETQEEVDVVFKVKGEVFRAHRLVLAMRSPVFKAELCGPMKHKGMESITIEEMEPAVFRTLLRFIYTDSLPDDLDGDDNDMAQHLLVAADRYGMERMKLMCESILCRKIDVESVATTLALADQHHCNKLKDVCIEFINSCERIGDLVASKGYEHLKRACPTVFLDVWERSVKSRRI